MKIVDYIEQEVRNQTVNVLEIGSFHSQLTSKLHYNNIKITATEVIANAPIFEIGAPYNVYQMDYVEALTLQHWDIVISTNVIHHLHSPYHFWDMVLKNSNQAIVTSCMRPKDKGISHIPSNDYGPHTRRIILSPQHHISYLEEHGWKIKDYQEKLLDNLNRPSWLINAIKNS